MWGFGTFHISLLLNLLLQTTSTYFFTIIYGWMEKKKKKKVGPENIGGETLWGRLWKLRNKPIRIQTADKKEEFRYFITFILILCKCICKTPLSIAVRDYTIFSIYSLFLYLLLLLFLSLFNRSYKSKLRWGSSWWCFIVCVGLIYW